MLSFKAVAFLLVAGKALATQHSHHEKAVAFLSGHDSQAPAKIAEPGATAPKPDPCIPCDYADHKDPTKCKCPPGVEKGAIGCVATRCANQAGEISRNPKRCPEGMRCAACDARVAVALCLAIF